MSGLLRPRLLLPMLIALAAIGMLVYGAAFHTTGVLVTKEVPAAAPPPKAPPPAQDAFAQFLGVPKPPPEVEACPVDEKPPSKKTETVVENDHEPRIIRDVTVGGVVRTAEGKIKRTYTGKPLSLCPT